MKGRNACCAIIAVANRNEHRIVETVKEFEVLKRNLRDLYGEYESPFSPSPINSYILNVRELRTRGTKARLWF